MDLLRMGGCWVMVRRIREETAQSRILNGVNSEYTYPSRALTFPSLRGKAHSEVQYIPELTGLPPHWIQPKAPAS
ncbi:hypothetical protein VUR80DRAFT_8632 [Thermomyces stellatus]